MRRHLLVLSLLCATLLTTGCATPPLQSWSDAQLNEQLDALASADALLLGEQHDAPAHQQLQRQVVQRLAARRQLAALALEMAERGASTRGLPADASEDQVRAALRWQERAWPWGDYGPVVMAAVRAGVPVWGANLPRAEQAAVLQDSTWDARLDAAAFLRQQRQIEDAHCGQLPAARIVPMARIQVARDHAMADTLVQLQAPGRMVLLVAGAQHVRRDLGVPRHLPAGLQARVWRAVAASDAAADREGLAPGDLLWPTPAPPPRDHCAGLRIRPAAPG